MSGRLAVFGGFALAAIAVGVMVATTAIGNAQGTASGVRTIVLRTVEDPSVAPLPAGVCPFAGANVSLRAYAWSIAARASDGVVVEEQIQSIGIVRACALVTSLAPEATAPFFGRFELGDGVYDGTGTCTVVSNNVPRAGVVLAGCALKLIAFPAGVAGGLAASASVFTPAPVPGFSTGSFWTLRIY